MSKHELPYINLEREKGMKAAQNFERAKRKRKSGAPLLVLRFFVLCYGYGSSNALTRKTAIWARVTALFGQ